MNISVTSTATLILADNPQRLSLIITNNGSSTVYIGQTNTVTSTTGVPLQADSILTEDSGGTKMYCGPIWGITDTGTADVRVWERIR